MMINQENNDNNQLRHDTNKNVCPLCLAAVKSSVMHCRFTWRLWCQLLQLANISSAFPEKAIHLFPYGNPYLLARSL